MKSRKGIKKVGGVTPIRKSLLERSSLQGLVKDNLGAITRGHIAYFDHEIRPLFADSLDADAALRLGNEEQNRWDYVLGHADTGRLVAVEPHSAQNGEVSVVIRKRRAALEQLRPHLRDGSIISKWLWVSSGKVQFSPMEKAAFRLAENGIEFVGRKVLGKHLPQS